MYSEIFGNAACVKSWTGSNAIKKATKERVAVIPETDMVIAARFGRLKDPETGELHLDIKEPEEIVRLITERGWDDMPFDELATKLKTLHDNIPEAMKASLAESEIYLLQPKGVEQPKAAPKVKSEIPNFLQALFQKNACVKQWEGAEHVRKAARTTYSYIPGTDYLLAAKFGNVTDTQSGKRIDAKEPTYLAKFVVNQGWDGLPFEELADRLTSMHSRLKDGKVFGFKEAEIHLLQAAGPTSGDAERRVPIRKLG